MKGRGLAVLLLLAGGCSSTLPFNFSFGATDDGGTGGNDLAVDFGVRLDLAIQLDLGGNDQAMTLDDLAQVDLVNKIDQSVAGPDLTPSVDLRAASDLRVNDLNTQDLATLDQAKVRSPIGGPCTTADQCLSGLFCATQVPVGSTSIALPGGYCTKECSGVDPLECTEDAKCYDFGDKAICVRGCDTICPAARNLAANDYGCCSYQDASGPSDPPPVFVGCLPASIAGQGGYSCLVGSP